MAPFIRPFFEALLLILNLIQWTILVWVILSWILFFASQGSFRWRYRRFHAVLEQINDLLSRMTRPFLRPIRRMLRRFDTAGIDWSPMVLLIIIFIVRGLLVAAYNAILLP